MCIMNLCNNTRVVRYKRRMYQEIASGKEFLVVLKYHDYSKLSVGLQLI
jgi:hypothetical protein